MGKKKNKKFKSHVVATPKPLTANPSINIETSVAANAESAPIAPIVETEKPDEITQLNAQYQYVRRDVRKLMLTISLLVVLFVGAYFIGTKTSLWQTFGNWIYKIGNFQIQ